MNFGFSILDFRLNSQDRTKTCRTAIVWFRSDNRKSAIQNPKWLGLSVIACVLVVAGATAQAQQPKKVPRVGFLTTAGQSSKEAFRQGLRELNYVEGKNIIIDYRQTEGKAERLNELAAELARLKPDVIVAGSTQDVLAAKNASSTIPIVMMTVGDPVASKLVDSLARPGGNITGVTSLSPDVNGKRLELLKETVPTLSRVGVLWNPQGSGSPLSWKESQLAAQSLNIQLHSMEVRSPNDFGTAFENAIKARAHALVVTSNPVFSANQDRLVDLASKNRLPAIYGNRETVEAGGLMSYGTIYTDLYRRAATYVDKILKGAKPAELPVEQPMKFEFVINLKTAKQIGLTIPPNILARADRVIR
jgi:putative ABC transport system substrate-binding protein